MPEQLNENNHRSALEDAYIDIMHSTTAENLSAFIIKSREMGVNPDGFGKAFRQYKTLFYDIGKKMKDQFGAQSAEEYQQVIKSTISQYINLSLCPSELRSKEEWQKNIDGFKQLDLHNLVREHISGFAPQEAQLFFDTIEKHQQGWKQGVNITDGEIEKI